MVARFGELRPEPPGANSERVRELHRSRTEWLDSSTRLEQPGCAGQSLHPDRGSNRLGSARFSFAGQDHERRRAYRSFGS